MTDQYLILDDDGVPTGIINMDQVHTEGTRFAFALAAVCDDPTAMGAVQDDTLARLGVDMFSYVAACAVRVMAEHILSPAFDVAKVYDTDLRAGMAAIAAGETPT